jgi:hypothetical protein
MWWQRGGCSGNNGAFAATAWHMLIITLINTMMMMLVIDYSFIAGEGGKGVGECWLDLLLAAVAMDGNDNHNGDCLSKKGVG